MARCWPRPCVDLDNFKAIKQFAGHRVATECSSHRKATERLPVGRGYHRSLGGDEFGGEPADIRSSMNLFQIARKILNAISLPLDNSGARNCTSPPAIGIAIYPEHGQGCRDAD